MLEGQLIVAEFLCSSPVVRVDGARFIVVATDDQGGRCSLITSNLSVLARQHRERSERLLSARQRWTLNPH
jgi:hypothetical protein